MSRLIALRRLSFAALVTLGIAFACRARPGEAPPLAPRPEPTQPSTNPVPGAPDPIDPSTPGPNFPPEDAGVPGIPPTVESRTHGAVSVVPRPIYRAQASDGGVEDAGDDGDPPDAGTGEDAGADEPPPPPPDAPDPGPLDDGGLLPPVPDADLPEQPPDGGAPFGP